MERMDDTRECDGDMNRNLENDKSNYRLSRKAVIFAHIWGNSLGNLE